MSYACYIYQLYWTGFNLLYFWIKWQVSESTAFGVLGEYYSFNNFVHHCLVDFDGIVEFCSRCKHCYKYGLLYLQLKLYCFWTLSMRTLQFASLLLNVCRIWGEYSCWTNNWLAWLSISIDSYKLILCWSVPRHDISCLNCCKILVECASIISCKDS